MKTFYFRIITSCILLFVGANSYATNFYTFSQSTSTYTELVSPTVISRTTSPLYNFSGATPTSYISVNLFPSMVNLEVFGLENTAMRVYGGEVDFYNSIANEIFYINGFCLFYPDGLKDRGATTSLSPISYQISGTAPNQILKVQWKNAGCTTGTSDYMNMQIWFYGSDKSIEFHYGSSSITNGSSRKVSVGIGHMNDLTYNIVEENFLANGPSNPKISIPTDPDFIGIPADGTVYRFAETGTGINEAVASNLLKKVGDNLVNPTNLEVDIYSVMGVKLTTSSLSTINLSTLPSGVYIASTGLGNLKFVK